ncbi:hypothetical protein E2C01_016406 [Portunus trituberculatus]|uniref:Uncharacterized protein n=1 Tax=Portunus trituberculatus TaxID=210409 RepID=A0A5B7DP15_PORTR|nr:hypothetical protein [Portunus trituberculatus]
MKAFGKEATRRAKVIQCRSAFPHQATPQALPPLSKAPVITAWGRGCLGRARAPQGRSRVRTDDRAEWKARVAESRGPWGKGQRDTGQGRESG